VAGGVPSAERGVHVLLDGFLLWLGVGMTLGLVYAMVR